MNLSPVNNIPKNWNIVELQTTGEVIYGIQASVANNTEPIGTKIITNKNISLDGQLIFEKQNYFEIKTASHRKTLLNKGDILFNWRSGSKDHVGKTAYFDLDGEYTHSSFILRIRPNTRIINGKYLYYYLYWLRTSKYFIKVHSYAINAKFNKTGVNSLPTILPPLEEQRKIAGVLSLVQDAIAQQEQLIILTTELKKALMQKLFTEGTRNEPQKMTEIGLIPESWKVLTVGEVCRSIVPGRNKPKIFDGDIPWLTTPEIKDLTFITESIPNKFVSRQHLKEIGGKIVPPNSVIMTCAGELGISVVTKVSLVINQQLHAFICPDNLEPYFLCQTLRSRKKYMEQISHKTTVPYLNKSKCESIPIIIPSLKEQQDISKKLLLVDSKLKEHSFKKNYLNELFHTLLHKLMTAQIRVDDLNLSALNLEPQGGNE